LSRFPALFSSFLKIINEPFGKFRISIWNGMRPLEIGLLIVALVSDVGLASDSGTTGADFLNMGIGPRAIAMGNAQVGLADDVYATYWNPAGLSQLQSQEAGFVHTDYVESITEQYAAYATPYRRWGNLGFSFTYLGVGSFQGYDAVGSPTSQVSASDMAGALSYSHDLYSDRQFGTKLAAGITGKWIQERLDSVSGTAYAGDAGLLFKPGIKFGEFFNGWRAGVVLRNMGSALRFDQDSSPLPRTMVAGLSYSGDWRNESYTVAIDARQPNAGKQSMGVGLELWSFKKVLVIRGGYTSEGDWGNGLRAGGGLQFKKVEIDYAYASDGAFGVVNRLGITLRWAPAEEDPVYLSEKWCEKGMRDYRRHRYNDAEAEFDKALALDPQNQKALEMMKKAYEGINLLSTQ
jgi:hypothetical protein